MSILVVIIESIVFCILIFILVSLLLVTYCKRKKCDMAMIVNIQTSILCFIHISSFFSLSKGKDSLLCKLQTSLLPSSFISIFGFYNMYHVLFYAKIYRMCKET